jgi:hypothetical protein
MALAVLHQATAAGTPLAQQAATSAEAKDIIDPAWRPETQDTFLLNSRVVRLAKNLHLAQGGQCPGSAELARINFRDIASYVGEVLRQVNSPLRGLITRLKAVPEGVPMPFCLTDSLPREVEFLSFLIAFELVLDTFDVLYPNPNDELCLARAEGLFGGAYEAIVAVLKFRGNSRRAVFLATAAKAGAKAMCGGEVNFAPSTLVDVVDTFAGQVHPGAAREAACAATQRRVSSMWRACASAPRQTGPATPPPPRAFNEQQHSNGNSNNNKNNTRNRGRGDSRPQTPAPP